MIATTRSNPVQFRTPVAALRAALFGCGLPVREEYDDLVLERPEIGLRVHLVESDRGWAFNLSVSVAEGTISSGAISLFSEMASEGCPVVGVGACGRRLVCEFNWFHPLGVEWRISAERCQALVDRVFGARIASGLMRQPRERSRLPVAA
jgi:hypothetical protein